LKRNFETAEKTNKNNDDKWCIMSLFDTGFLLPEKTLKAININGSSLNKRQDEPFIFIAFKVFVKSTLRGAL